MSPEMQETLFSAVCKYRPIGVHKHFRMLAIQKYFNSAMGTTTSTETLWKELAKYYDLELLDAAADEHDQENIAVEKRAIYPFLNQLEFTLPSDDFDSVIDEFRKADTSTEVSSAVSPAPVKRLRTRASRASLTKIELPMVSATHATAPTSTSTLASDAVTDDSQLADFPSTPIKSENSRNPRKKLINEATEEKSTSSRRSSRNINIPSTPAGSTPATSKRRKK